MIIVILHNKVCTKSVKKGDWMKGMDLPLDPMLWIGPTDETNHCGQQVISILSCRPSICRWTQYNSKTKNIRQPANKFVHAGLFFVPIGWWNPNFSLL